jgi:hypothetical protein
MWSSPDAILISSFRLPEGSVRHTHNAVPFSSILNTEPEMKLVVKNDIKKGAVDLQTAIVVDET